MEKYVGVFWLDDSTVVVSTPGLVLDNGKKFLTIVSLRHNCFISVEVTGEGGIMIDPLVCWSLRSIT